MSQEGKPVHACKVYQEMFGLHTYHGWGLQSLVSERRKKNKNRKAALERQKVARVLLLLFFCLSAKEHV